MRSVCEEEESKKGRICRICHGGDDFQDLVNSKTLLFFMNKRDQLISPCGCRGTMRFVHKSCLNEWRTASPRSDSFYKCEQCFENYRFKAHSATLLVSSKCELYLTSRDCKRSFPLFDDVSYMGD